MATNMMHLVASPAKDWMPARSRHWESFVEKCSTHLYVPFDTSGFCEGDNTLLGVLENQSFSITQLWDPSFLEINYGS
jgi:hypothetical protein